MSICLNDVVPGMVETEETNEMFQSLRHVLLMLQRRGYEVGHEPWHDTYEDFVKLWYTAANYTAFTLIGVRDDDICIVFWPFEEKLRINSIRDIINICNEKKYTHIIIVYSGIITSFAKQQLQVIKSTSEIRLRIETFNTKYFQYDVLDHLYVPKHRLLTKEETQVFMNKYKIQYTDLPIIYSTDPIAKYFGMRPKQVIEILRPSPEGFFYKNYRVCMKGNILK
jgi:DNA-directed RNA polymerases I, II, and III subunit RPABC1